MNGRCGNLHDVVMLMHPLDVARLRAPASPHYEVHMRHNFGNAQQNIEPFMRAGVDHSNFVSFRVDTLCGQLTGMWIEVCEGTVHHLGGCEISVLFGVLLKCLGNGPDTVTAAEELVLRNW